MRELIFKNLMQPKANKRDVSIEEVVEKDGLFSSTQKRSMYFVRGVRHMESKEEMQEWMHDERKHPDGKKFFHVLRKYSAQNKEDRLICKIRGSFYVVSDFDIYNIVFVHAIKITLKETKRA